MKKLILFFLLICTLHGEEKMSSADLKEKLKNLTGEQVNQIITNKTGEIVLQWQTSPQTSVKIVHGIQDNLTPYLKDLLDLNPKDKVTILMNDKKNFPFTQLPKNSEKFILKSSFSSPWSKSSININMPAEEAIVILGIIYMADDDWIKGEIAQTGFRQYKSKYAKDKILAFLSNDFPEEKKYNRRQLTKALSIFTNSIIIDPNSVVTKNIFQKAMAIDDATDVGIFLKKICMIMDTYYKSGNPNTADVISKKIEDLMRSGLGENK